LSERTYSAYDLDKFQTCPKLWDLSKRWEVPEVEWPVSLHMGAAVAVGLAWLRNGSPREAAEHAAYLELSRRYVDNDEWSLEGVMKHVYRGMTLGFASDIGVSKIISADNKKYGRCRPDVVGRTADGKLRLRIVDDKVKLKLDAKYIDETLAEFRHSNQLYEYAWEVGRYYNEPVDSVCINLIILSPKPQVIFDPIKISPEAIEYWAASAMADFDEMFLIQGGLRSARTRWMSCTTKYNKRGTFEKALCPMYALCHDLHGDESKAEALYVRKG
jgi:hypothetical protein